MLLVLAKIAKASNSPHQPPDSLRGPKAMRHFIEDVAWRTVATQEAHFGYICTLLLSRYFVGLFKSTATRKERDLALL